MFMYMYMWCGSSWLWRLAAFLYRTAIITAAVPSLLVITMKAFLAMKEKVALEASTVGKLVASDLSDKCRYLPLKESVELAVGRAMDRASAQNAEDGDLCAKEPTTIYILEITLSSDQALGYFQEETLRRNAKSGGWEWVGELPLGTFSHSWAAITIAPLGISSWAERRLDKSYKKQLGGMCSQCRSVGTVWQPRKRKYNDDDFCSECWHAFVQERRMSGGENADKIEHLMSG